MRFSFFPFQVILDLLQRGYRDFCKKKLQKKQYIVGPFSHLPSFFEDKWRFAQLIFFRFPGHTYIHFLLLILQEEDLATTRITRSASGCAPPSTSAATTMRSCSIPSANMIRSMSGGSAKLRIIPNRGHCLEHSEVDEIETVL